MRSGKYIPIYIIAVFAWIIINSSCANQGMPTGGPRDSIPPVLVNTYPAFGVTGFGGNEVRLTFNEYIIPDGVQEKLVVSPPLAKRPTIQTKSRTLIIKFNEELKDSTTYSLDFKNSVVDNNERNEYRNLRHAFSTGQVFDTLRVAGRVVDAFNLEAKKNVLVMLHSNLHDSAVYTVIPDYIARTDEMGIFYMDNIAPGTYNVFSITDNNSNLLYDEGAEEIAFVNELVKPSAEFVETRDTLVSGVDSLLITGHTHFHPDPFFLRQFREDLFDQFLEKHVRNSANLLTVVFSESVEDTFNIRLLNADTEDWHVIEYNEQVDSLSIWLADTTLIKMDTLIAELAYFALDTTGQLYVRKDTVDFSFRTKEDDSKKRRKPKEQEDDKPEPVPQFSFGTSIGSNPFDLNKDIVITAPEPLEFFDSSMVSLYLMNDTLRQPVNFRFFKDTTQWRTYRIAYNWKPETAYTLQIDSAASANIYGVFNKKLINKFETRPRDYYGTVKLNLTGVEDSVIIQLLENTEEEVVIEQMHVSSNGEVEFNYLPPTKFRLKAIFDRNGNGKWDVGSYQDQILPEKVTYINEVIKIRSNWDNSYSWELSPDETIRLKNIRDPEEEQKKRQEEQENRKLQREQREPLRQNNMMRGGGNDYMRR